MPVIPDEVSITMLSAVMVESFVPPVLLVLVQAAITPRNSGRVNQSDVFFILRFLGSNLFLNKSNSIWFYYGDIAAAGPVVM
jgi:hypothetical protein